MNSLSSYRCYHRSMAHKRSVLVSDIPSYITKEKLTIHFQKSHNGGGDVTNVVYPLSGSRPNEAMITFDDEEVCERVQHTTQIMDDKWVQVKQLPHQVFSSVQAFIDDDILMAIPSDKLQYTLHKLQDETGVQLEHEYSRDTGKYAYKCSGNWIQVKKVQHFLKQFCIEPKEKPKTTRPARNGDLDDQYHRAGVNGSRSEYSGYNGLDSMQNGIDNDITSDVLHRSFVTDRPPSRRGRQSRDQVSDIHADSSMDSLSSDVRYKSLPDTRFDDRRSSGNASADVLSLDRTLRESRRESNHVPDDSPADRPPSRNRQARYDTTAANDMAGYRGDHVGSLSNQQSQYSDELLLASRRKKGGSAAIETTSDKSNIDQKSKEAKTETEPPVEEETRHVKEDIHLQDHTGHQNTEARVEVIPVLVDIDLYMFMKHTQRSRLQSIETDCDVTFQCDETADTGMVSIQPNSQRTIPEQTQLARDQFVSLYDNLYQTIDKFDMHIPKGLDETTGEAAAEKTKENFSNIYIKKEGAEHYAMYGDKESLQSARLHFLSCLCHVLEGARNQRDEMSRELHEDQQRPKELEEPSDGIPTSSASEFDRLETDAVKADEVEDDDGDPVTRREPSGESESEELVPRKSHNHGVTVLSNNSRELTFLTDHGVKAKVHCADITKLAVDAITNAAHEQLINTGGVAYAIRKAAGPYYHRECEEYIDNHGPLYVTEVIHTGAGILPCKYVLHAVGPRWEDYKNKNECVETLKATIINSFNHANDLLNIQSLALPLISSGVFGVPLDMVAQAMFEAVITFSKEHPRGEGNLCLTEIHIVDFEKSSLANMQQVFRENLRMAGCNDVVEPSPSSHRELDEQRGRSPREPLDEKHETGSRPVVRDRPATPPSWVRDDLVKAESANTDEENHRRLFSSERVRGSQKDKHRSIFSSERLTRPKEDRESRTKAQDSERSSAFQQYRLAPAFDKYSPLKSLSSPRTGITGERIQPSLRPKTADRYHRGHQSESSAVKPMRATIDALGMENSIDDDLSRGAVGGEPSGIARVVSATDKEALVKEILDEHEKGPHTKESSRETQKRLENLFVDDEFSPIRSSGGARSRTRSLDRSRPKTADGSTRARSSSMDRKKAMTGSLELGSTVRRCQLCRTSKNLSTMKDCSHFICSTCKKYSRDCYDCLQLSSKRDTSKLRVQATSLQPSMAKTQTQQQTSQRKERPRSATPNFTSSSQRPPSPSISRQRPSTPNLTSSRSMSMPRPRSATPTPSSSGHRPSTPTMTSSRQRSATPTIVSPRRECPICMDKISNPKTLRQCQHTFCKDCIERAMDQKPVCPVCGVIYGPLRGDQPDGTMDISVDKSRQLPGYPGCGTVCITYTFPDGIQIDRHPHPGRPYQGTRRRAYLPDNSQGREVLQLLKKAFQAKLLFTVGQSVTTGLDDVVVWNDIHQKTSRHGGPANHGYPDPSTDIMSLSH
ncbi:uncharacterized protein [Ptychodera flava]|uniref:uncharacterized protein isoform X2 n=1 Tax=Ptychodera flava TaxID=63121 RepID=UPI00396A8646